MLEKTKQHIASTILNQEGDKHIASKWLLGIIPETENHILMTEGSRYLKNQLVQKHGLSYSTYKLPPEKYNNELDSLKLLSKEKSSPKIFPAASLFSKVNG